MLQLSELEYQPDSARWFGHLLDLPQAVFLDSGQGSPFAGRYDILAADPWMTISTGGGETTMRTARGIERSGDDPLRLLEASLGPSDPDGTGLPFAGGAIGCFAYDLGRRFERLPEIARRDIAFPEMQIGLYDWAYVVDHLRRKTWLVGAGRAAETRRRWADLSRLPGLAARPRPPFEVVSGIESNFSREAYARVFDAVQEHIRLGDCYQVNLAQRFRASARGDSFAAYLALRRISPAPFSAFISTPHGDILSSSPERFLLVDGDRAQTRPIKGTRPRGADATADAGLRLALTSSPKDRAENVMIVDLLRNDFGKVCAPGSVSATRLFEIESFAHVHHMLSTVTGRLAAGQSALDLLRACFPGGSVTGAPKLRAMEIIDALEPERRSVYCGSIGYIGHNGRMDLNIAIRTMLRVDDSIYAWAGGGIVADSNCAAEYQESLDKASGLLAVLAESRISAAG